MNFFLLIKLNWVKRYKKVHIFCIKTAFCGYVEHINSACSKLSIFLYLDVFLHQCYSYYHNNLGVIFKLWNVSFIWAKKIFSLSIRWLSINKKESFWTYGWPCRSRLSKNPLFNQKQGPEHAFDVIIKHFISPCFFKFILTFYWFLRFCHLLSNEFYHCALWKGSVDSNFFLWCTHLSLWNPMQPKRW